MDTNYFVCTLGEAGQRERPFPTVCSLIAEQAKNNPSLPAVGFYHVDSSYDTRPETLNFDEIHRGINHLTTELSDILHGLSPGRPVGLLCSSSPDFLFTWLTCIWLRHPVLIIAPDCTASNVADLCRQCNASLLLTDVKHEDLALQASKVSFADGMNELKHLRPSYMNTDVLRTVKEAPPAAEQSTEQSTSNPAFEGIAYFHHTSGTSSGSPKPIPQSHHGAVGALPCLDDRGRATFTTTPLYHGGPADVFRAWTSNAMIWLFPGRDLPITPSNVVKCLQSTSAIPNVPPIKFFASVPYVLEGMADDEDGLRYLQSFDLVGVGGAALSDDTGNSIVGQGVNLVSRFGSAECGFLLSSHRDYENDRDWQYLRKPKSSPSLRFEARDENLCELIVLADWPHRAKTNREDGSYATSDLFQSHPHRHGAWRYHSRADAQLTLVTGKKLDPQSVEEAIRSNVPEISDALVFGNGQTHPGVLLARSYAAKDLESQDVIQAALSIIEKLNETNQKHAKIPKNMLIPVPYSEKPFPKSSKGTVLRKQAEDVYHDYIDSAYETQESSEDELVPDEELSAKIKSIVCDQLSVSNPAIDDQTDLFSIGIDSVAGIQIRQRLQRLLQKQAVKLPTTMVEDCGTVGKLAEHISNIRNGNNANNWQSKEANEAYMWKLVDEYSQFMRHEYTQTETSSGENAYEYETVVLTGATGALGAHILSQLIHSQTVKKIYCLVRGAREQSAHERIVKALERRHLSKDELADTKRTIVLQSNIGEPRLGLDEETYAGLARNTTLIIHAAWSVNFRMRLQSFVRDSIASVRNLIELALSSAHGARFVFCSSVASVMSSNEHTIPETIADDPSSAGELGYSQSKWVAERVCQAGARDSRIQGHFSILRIGQLSGDTKMGIWNSKEAWPIMLSTIKLTETLPDLGEEILNWLPVDIAATAVIEAGRSVSNDRNSNVFHIVNTSARPTWSDILQWLSKHVPFSIVPVAQWIRELEAKAEEIPNHPAYQLIDHWKRLYLSDEPSRPTPSFQMEKTKAAIPALRTPVQIDEAYFGKLWARLEEDMANQ